ELEIYRLLQLQRVSPTSPMGTSTGDAMMNSKGSSLWHGLLLLLPLLGACESETLKPEPLDGRQLFWRLSLSHRAVVMSTQPPYNTLAVVAIPRNVDDEPLSGLPEPVYE